MGSTITTGRVAAAVQAHDGRTLFILFEESSCSNVSPQTPSWCCMAIGTLSTAMERIFGLASQCEGGMLRNRSGRLTPESYIGTWLKELANPLTFSRTDIRLEVGDGFYQAIKSTQLDQAVDILAAAGRSSQANELHDAQRVTLDLLRDTDAVLALKAGLQISPWLLVSKHSIDHRHGTRNPALGYTPKPVKASLPEGIMALKLNAEVRLQRDADGDWRCGGWQYGMVGQYVREFWQTELACPGHHRKQISAYRDALDRAPPAPGGLVVEIDSAGTEEDYYLKRIAELRQGANGHGSVFQVPVTKETEYALSNLPHGCARWLLPDQPPQTASIRQAALAL